MYVVFAFIVTDCEPLTEIATPPGLSTAEVALEDVQVSVTTPPDETEAADEISVHTGLEAGAGGTGGAGGGGRGGAGGGVGGGT